MKQNLNWGFLILEGMLIIVHHTSLNGRQSNACDCRWGGGGKVFILQHGSKKISILSKSDNTYYFPASLLIATLHTMP